MYRRVQLHIFYLGFGALALLIPLYIIAREGITNQTMPLVITPPLVSLYIVLMYGWTIVTIHQDKLTIAMGRMYKPLIIDLSKIREAKVVRLPWSQYFGFKFWNGKYGDRYHNASEFGDAYETSRFGTVPTGNTALGKMFGQRFYNSPTFARSFLVLKPKDASTEYMIRTYLADEIADRIEAHKTH